MFQAFIKAWKHACSSKAVATIEIPAENVYLVRPIQLGGPCEAKLKMLVRFCFRMVDMII